MKLALKNFQSIPEMTRETVAFRADLILEGPEGGVFLAAVSNEGQGGADFYAWDDGNGGVSEETAHRTALTCHDLDDLCRRIGIPAPTQGWAALDAVVAGLVAAELMRGSR